MKKKRCAIAVVTWIFPKISETFVLNQIVFLLNKGYRVKIYAIKDATKNPAKEDFEPESITHPAITHYRLLKKITRTSLSNLPTVLNRDVIKNKVDLIYFQFPDLASAVLKAASFTIPTITTVHDLPKITLSNKNMLADKFFPVFNDITFILAISKFTKQELLRLGCPAKKIIVHPMGVEPSFFHLRTISPRTKEIHITSVGRFVPKKGFEDSIEALRILRGKYPKKKIILTLVGDGILRPVLETKVRRLKFNEVVRLMGKLDQAEVRKILTQTNIFLCPSHTDLQGKREGLPVALIEATLMGIPAIATNHAAIPELASLNPAIILVRENSPLEIAKAVGRMIKHYSVYSWLAKQSRKQIAAVYGMPALGDSLIKIFIRANEVTKIQQTLKLFSLELRKAFGKQLVCVFLTGSIARLEQATRESDIDLIIVASRVNQIFLRVLHIQVAKLSRALSVPIIPQVMDTSDFTQLLSPVLLQEYLLDGDVLLGKDFLNTIPPSSFRISEIAILKRMLFQRYLIRQKMTTKAIGAERYSIAKAAFFLMKYYIWIACRIYPTNREDVFIAWYSTKGTMRFMPSATMAIAHILSHPEQEVNTKIIWRIADFIEFICTKTMLILNTRHDKININSF